MPLVVLDPPSSLVDDPLAVTVTGLTPGHHVTLTATLEDDGKRFYSWAWYTADSQGDVDVTVMPSTVGTYVRIIILI